MNCTGKNVINWLRKWFFSFSLLVDRNILHFRLKFPLTFCSAYVLIEFLDISSDKSKTVRKTVASLYNPFYIQTKKDKTQFFFVKSPALPPKLHFHRSFRDNSKLWQFSRNIVICFFIFHEIMRKTSKDFLTFLCVSWIIKFVENIFLRIP